MLSTYSIVICEDNPLHAGCLREQVLTLPYAERLSIATAADAQQLMSVVGQQKPDILLMDIVLGGDNGIELVKDLHAAYPNLQIIYVSGYLEYFSRVYETDHCWFLLKPVETGLLDQALQRAMERLGSGCEIKIPVKFNGATELVAQKDICYIESKGRKVYIYLEHSVIETYTSLNELSKLLGRQFLRSHKSYIVNLDKVQRLTKDGFLLSNDAAVPISQSRYRETKEAFFAYIGGSL